MQTVTHHHGPLEGRITRYDFSPADVATGVLEPVIESPVNCVDGELRVYLYLLERRKDGGWNAYPHPDHDQGWWEWGVFVVSVAMMPLVVGGTRINPDHPQHGDDGWPSRIEIDP